jgi:hypothetical protein
MAVLLPAIIIIQQQLVLPRQLELCHGHQMLYFFYHG